MKKKFTFTFLTGGKKSTFLVLAGILFLTSVLFIGCYKFRSINQPTDGYTNSYFDVPIKVERDADPGTGDAEWNSAALADIGLFGVMVPDGWTVDDNIPYTIVSKNAAKTNTGILIYDAANTAKLQASYPALANYHWWGAVTDRIASMDEFDSLYFKPRIKTDGKTGTFNLRYAIGDKNSAGRNPADVARPGYGEGLSDFIAINITNSVGLTELLSKTNVSMYPNPTRGILNVNLKGYKSQVVQMNICDSRGRVVMSKEILKSSNAFDLSGLPKGVYVVQLKNGKNSSNSKIVVN